MKGKTSVLSRSWANLPPPLLSMVLHHLWISARTSLPRSWGSDQRLWHSAMIYRALRDIGPLANLMLVCASWMKALQFHPVWAHLIALLDPQDIMGIQSIANGRHSSVKIRISPYIHYTRIINSSCLICRINQPHTSQGVANGRMPNIHSTSTPRGGIINSTTFGNFTDGLIPVCKHHRNDESYCSVCLKELPPVSHYRDDLLEEAKYALGIYSNDDTLAFPNASTSCRMCRIAYLSLLAARHQALQVIGGANFLHQPALDWEPRTTIDAYIDQGDGTAESVLRLCKEKWWLRKETKLSEFVRLAIRSERLAMFGDVGREDFEDDVSDEDEEEDPTEMSVIEDGGAKDMAIREWMRVQMLKGDWRDTQDVWEEAAILSRSQRKQVDVFRITNRFDSDVLRFDADFEWDSDYEEEVECLEDGVGWIEDDSAPRPYSPTPEEMEESEKIVVKRPCWWSFVIDIEEEPSHDSEAIVLPPSPEGGDNNIPLYSDSESDHLSDDALLEDADEMDPELKFALELSLRDHEAQQGHIEREGAPSPPPSNQLNGHPEKLPVRRQSSQPVPKAAQAPKRSRPRVETEDVAQIKHLALPSPLSPHFPPTHILAETISLYYPSVMKSLLHPAFLRLVLALERVAAWWDYQLAYAYETKEDEGGKIERHIDPGFLASKLTIEDVIGLIRDVDEFWYTLNGGSPAAAATSSSCSDESGASELDGREEWDAVEREVEKVVWKWLPASSILGYTAPPGGGGSSVDEAAAMRKFQLLGPVPWFPTDLTRLGKNAKSGLAQVWRATCGPLYHCKCSICERARRTEKQTDSDRQQAEQQAKQDEAAYEESLRERFGVLDQRPPAPQQQQPLQNPYPPASLYPPAPIDETAKGRPGTILIPARVGQPPLTIRDVTQDIQDVKNKPAVETEGRKLVPMEEEEEEEVEEVDCPSPTPSQSRQRKRSRDDLDETPCNIASSLPSPPSLEDEEGDGREIKKVDIGTRVKGAMHLEGDCEEIPVQRERKRSSEELELDDDDQVSEKRVKVK